MQGFPVIRSIKSGLWCVAPFALLLLIFSAMPLAGVNIALFCLTAGPLLVCLAGALGGLAPMISLLFICLWLLYGVLGPQALLFGALYLGGAAACSLACFSRKIPFWRAVALHTAALFAAQLALLLYLNARLGGDLIATGAALLTQGLSELPDSDMLLYQLVQMGFLPLSESFGQTIGQVVEGALILDDAVRADLLKAALPRIESLLMSFVPSQLVGNSVLFGVLCVACPISFSARSAARRARRGKAALPPLPPLGMPPLRTWFLPRGWGLRVGALALGYALALAAPSAPLLLAGQMMFAAFQAVYMLQGVAVTDFLLVKRGRSVFARRALPIVFYLLVPSVLVTVGVMDQLFDLRKLRPRPAPPDGQA